MLGPEKPLHHGGCAPNFVKDGTPQIALSAAYQSQRAADTRGNSHPLVPRRRTGAGLDLPRFCGQ
jgi:hypothetical protein